MKKLLALLLLLAPLGYAQNLGLSVAPIQMIFAPRQTIQTFTVSNRSANTTLHRLNLSDEVMQENGSLATQAEGFEYSAKKMIRFSPNEITLGPGESQIVRVMIRRPADLKDGDYHTHVMFEEQLTETDKREGGLDAEGQFKTNLKTLLTLGIPVIVQHGKIERNLEMVGLVGFAQKLEDGNYSPFEIHFKRQGNATGVGYITLKDPNGQNIMAPRSVSVYRERDEVKMTSQATEYGQTYKGPATLTLYAGNKANTPVVKVIDVQIP